MVRSPLRPVWGLRFRLRGQSSVWRSWRTNSSIQAHQFAHVPQGGVQPFRQKPNGITKRTRGPYVAQIWSRNPRNLRQRNVRSPSYGSIPRGNCEILGLLAQVSKTGRWTLCKGQVDRVPEERYGLPQARPCAALVPGNVNNSFGKVDVNLGR